MSRGSQVSSVGISGLALCSRMGSGGRAEVGLGDASIVRWQRIDVREGGL